MNEKRETSRVVSPKGTRYPGCSTHFTVMERHCQPCNYEPGREKSLIESL